MKKFLLLGLIFVTDAIAEGYYYPVPPNPPGFVYALPPAYIVPPQQNYYAPPPVYLMPPPAPGITRGVPPTFVPFDTGRVVPRGGFKNNGE